MKDRTSTQQIVFKKNGDVHFSDKTREGEESAFFFFLNHKKPGVETGTFSAKRREASTSRQLFHELKHFTSCCDIIVGALICPCKNMKDSSLLFTVAAASCCWEKAGSVKIKRPSIAV